MSEQAATSFVRSWLDVVERTLATEEHRWKLVAGFVTLTVLATVLAGVFVGPGIGILVLAGGSLFGAIALFWSSLRAVFGETKLSPEDAFAIGAPSVEEEQKRAVLRAIKDLEFEHAVGKISKQDYDALIARYRMEAKRLLRLIEQKAQPERDAVEHLVQAHLAAAKAEKKKEKPPSKPAESKAESKAETEATACPSCDTENDVDAVFCKKCGSRLREEDA
ncbi:MAG TPA: zinc ribbon domain-containing protein [Polyangiaceae bacterium]|nr:zinc ribbon domain-containing protein [Polyangiaceae bacterium]